jgi:hypothetical protein
MNQSGENMPTEGDALPVRVDKSTAIVSSEGLANAMITGLEKSVVVEAGKDVPDTGGLIVSLREDSRFEEFLSNVETDPEIQGAFTRLVDSLRSSIMVAASLTDDASKEAVLAGARENITVFVREHAKSIFERVSVNQRLVETIKHLADDPEGMAASIPLSAADELVEGLDKGSVAFAKALFARIRPEAQKLVDELAEEWKDRLVAEVRQSNTRGYLLKPKRDNDLLVIGLSGNIDEKKIRSLQDFMLEQVRELNSKLKTRRLCIGLKTHPSKGMNHGIQCDLRDGGQEQVSRELSVSIRPYKLQGNEIV